MKRFESKESSQQENQMQENDIDMFQGAQASWKKPVAGERSRKDKLNHLHQFIYQHLKKSLKEKLDNKLKYFTYITNKAFHTGVSINEFDFHIGRKRGMTSDDRNKLTDEYVKILGIPFKVDNHEVDYYTSGIYKTTKRSNFKTNVFCMDKVC